MSINFLILCNINTSQFITVKIPKNKGIFDRDISHTVDIGMRKQFTKVLTVVSKHTHSINCHHAPLIEKLEEANRTDEDFRVWKVQTNLIYRFDIRKFYTNKYTT